MPKKNVSYFRNLIFTTTLLFKAIGFANCQNTTISITPTIETDSLPAELKETSALVFYNNLFYSLNDSFCPNSIYSFNKQGKITTEIKFNNINNYDWEELLSYKKYFYIGDFGNNDGTRKNLRIYYFKSDTLTWAGSKKVLTNADSICFKYSDQDYFIPDMRKTAYDCEAMIGLNDSLYLFTKRWNDYATIVYKIPLNETNVTAERADSFNIGYLVTAAAYEPSVNMLVLLGYKEYLPYISIFYSFKNSRFFDGNHLRINLMNMKNTQPEGIAINIKNRKLYFTSECTLTNPQRMYSIEIPEIILFP